MSSEYSKTEKEEIIEIRKIEDIEENEYGSIGNILILNLSKMHSENRWYNNGYNGEEAYVGGYSQLEPVPKMLLKKMLPDKEREDLLIIILASEIVCAKKTLKLVYERDDKVDVKYSVIASEVSFFKNQIAFYNPCAKEPQVKPVAKDDNDAIRNTHVKFEVIKTGEDSIIGSIRKVVSVINKVNEAREENKDEKAALFIDIHGGRRDDQLVVDAIISVLHEEEISVKAAYSIADGGQDIEDVTSKLHIFDFVAGMNEFINHGYAGSLERYVENDSWNGEKGVELKQLVKSMKKISGALSLCRMEEFGNELKALKNTIEDIESTWRKTDRSDGLAEMLIENLKKDYGVLLEDSHTFFDEVAWAEKKGFYQQCLAIIDAKTPAYVYDHLIDFESQKYFSIKTNKTGEEELKAEGTDKPNKDGKTKIWEYRDSNDPDKAIWLKKIVYRKRNEELKVDGDFCSARGKDNKYIVKFKWKNAGAAKKLKKDFETFGEIWKTLKNVRNNIFHVKDSSLTPDELEKKIDTYLAHKKKFDEDIPPYNATVAKNTKTNIWINVVGDYPNRASVDYDGRIERENLRDIELGIGDLISVKCVVVNDGGNGSIFVPDETWYNEHKKGNHNAKE